METLTNALCLAVFFGPFIYLYVRATIGLAKLIHKLRTR